MAVRGAASPFGKMVLLFAFEGIAVAAEPFAQRDRNAGVRRDRDAAAYWGLSSKWTENRVKPGRDSHFFLPYRNFPPLTTLRSVPSGRRAFVGAGTAENSGMRPSSKVGWVKTASRNAV